MERKLMNFPLRLWFIHFTLKRIPADIVKGESAIHQDGRFVKIIIRLFSKCPRGGGISPPERNKKIF